MDSKFPGIVVLGMAVAIALAVVIFTDKVEGPIHMCTAPTQCEGITHPSCEGAWTCSDSRCAWGCEVGGCVTPADCEGLTHIQCAGRWACDAGQCSYACEVGVIEPELSYDIGECDTSVTKGANLQISPVSDGIRIQQVLDYVCCAVIELRLEREGNLLKVIEKNTGDICKCMCSYDVDAQIKVLPGTYKVEVWGVEHEGYTTEKMGEAIVIVGKSPERVLFIDQHLHKDGRVLAGSYAYMFIDFPTYQFDEGTRKLEGMMDFNLTGLIAIYGSGMSLGGDAGSGAGTGLSPVYSAPTEVSGDMITRVWEDGTVSILHNNQTVTLRPGETWNEVKTWDETANNMGLIRLTTNDTIKNYGFIELGDISEW